MFKCPNCEEEYLRTEFKCSSCGEGFWQSREAFEAYLKKNNYKENQFKLQNKKDGLQEEEASQANDTDSKSFSERYVLSKMTIDDAEGNIFIAKIMAILAILGNVYLALTLPDYFIFIDIGIMSILLIGIWLKDVTSSVLLFIFFLLQKLTQWYGFLTEGEYFGMKISAGGIIIGLFFLNGFFLGALGTIRYRQLLPNKKRKLPYYWILSAVAVSSSLILALWSYSL